MTIWGLVDDRTGHTGQVLGVIARLGMPYVLKRLEYNLLGRCVPASLLPASLRGINRDTSSPIAPPWPSLVIAAGRRTLPVLRYIKQQSPSTRTVYLMWPERAQGIDLIAAPAHDRRPPSDKLVTTLAPLHAVTPEVLLTAAQAWAPQFAHLPRPWVAVSLGGNTKHGKYTPAHWRDVIRQAEALAGEGSILVTTSRRTPADALPWLPSMMTRPGLFHRWDTDKDNPYLGLLGASDAIVVTGDSLSMCAEACVSGKPVYIFDPASVMPEKHKRLHAALYARDAARPLKEGATLEWYPAEPLDDVGTVVEAIRARFPEVG